MNGYSLTARGVNLAGLTAALLLAAPVLMQAGKIPVIDVTDVYHPCQDIGDNFDLIMAYGLPEIDLKGVILDCTDEWRKTGIDPGFVSVLQLNYLFNRQVPCATIPWRRMTSLDDKILDAPGFQQQGLDLFLRILRESPEPVHVLSFGSARVMAVAYNRDPELCLRKIKLIYLCAGASNYDQEVEHNVRLDRLAIARLLRSNLPVALFPCGADNANSTGYGVKQAVFSYCPNNCFWKMPNSEFINQMDKRLSRYLAYAYSQEGRPDVLFALDQPKIRSYTNEHYVWETAVWLEVSGRRLVKRADGSFRILTPDKVTASDKVLPNEIQPCQVRVNDDGLFYWEPAKQPSTRKWIYYRGDPFENDKALNDALPALYKSFNPDLGAAP